MQRNIKQIFGGGMTGNPVKLQMIFYIKLFLLTAFALSVPEAAAAAPVRFDFDTINGKVVSSADGEVQGKVSDDAFGPLLAQGVKGRALWFIGDERGNIKLKPNANLNATEALTIQAWLWPQCLGDHQGIVWKGDRSIKPERVQYKLSIRPEGRVEFGCMNARGDWVQVISTQPLTCGRWTLVTAIFDKGAVQIFFNQERVATGNLTTDDGKGGKTTLTALPANTSPVEIGRFQRSGGNGNLPFFGGMDELTIVPQAWPAPTGILTPLAGNPLQSLQLFDKKIEVTSLASTPVLTGQLTGTGGWMLEVCDPAHEENFLRCRGEADANGRFRYLLDDYCGKFDISAQSSLRCRAYRIRENESLRSSEVRFAPGEKTIQVTVNPDLKKQVLGPVSIYANAPSRFIEDAAERRQVYGPILAEMRAVGVTHFDLAFGSLATIEPRNDDADPQRMDMDFFRANFKTQPEAQMLMKFLRYLRSEGFTFGIRSTGFAKWQIPTNEKNGQIEYNVDEIAETWVALLLLMKEENLLPTHLIPIWEPAYAPETVARICATTTRLARKHGLDTPVVGPYAYGTGGQSTKILAMPDKFEEGSAYVREYLKQCGDMTPVIALEDYASGTPLIRPNLERMWKEVINPLSGGKPREMWMVEYGAPCGLGPWNFFPSRWHGALSSWESAFRLARSMNQLIDGGVNRFFFWKAWDSIGETKMVTPSSWGLVKGILHDEERRPPFYTARLYWNHLQEGAQIIGCSAEADLAVNAAMKDRSIAVFLVNPRAETVTANVTVAKTQLAAQARLLSATEEIQYQERDIYGQGANSFQVKLAPHSINTLLLRRSASTISFEQTRWPAQQKNIIHLSDMLWNEASTSKGAMKADSINGMDVNWRRDETWSGDWLVHQSTRYRKGLSVQGKGEIRFSIPETAKSFECRLGVDDGSSGQGPVNFIIKLDGKNTSAAESLKRGDAAKIISIPVTGAKVLTLQLESKDSKATSDWLEARLVLGQ